MNQNPNSPTKNFCKVPNIVTRTPGLSFNAKLVLCHLYTYGNRCYPSQPTIAKCLGASVPVIIRAIQELERKNVISYVKGSGRRKKSNQYTIRPVSDWILVKEDIREVNSTPKESLVVEGDVPLKICEATPKESLVEPLKNLYSNKTYIKRLKDKDSNSPLNDGERIEDLNQTPDHEVPADNHEGLNVTETEKAAYTAMMTFKLLGDLPETMWELLRERDLYEHHLRAMPEAELKALFTEHFESMAKDNPAA